MSAEIDEEIGLKLDTNYMVPILRHVFAIMMAQAPEGTRRNNLTDLYKTLLKLPDSTMVHLETDPDTNRLEIMGSFK